MGQPPTVHVDVAAIRAVAGCFDSVAGLAGRAAVRRLAFDARSAGRAYAAEDGSLRGSVEPLIADLHAWGRAAEEIAVGLRCGAERYADSERGVAERIG
jgi:hypothetical protein